jgi:hypothetical protein
VNMRKHGFEPGWGPGRHGPGNNIFCYFKEPVNYVVEPVKPFRNLTLRGNRRDM